jgi:ribosomal protein S18 acetylase RimI-like enzyme
MQPAPHFDESNLPHLQGLASNPRQAKPSDIPQLAQLFTNAYEKDPLMSWYVQTGDKRLTEIRNLFQVLLERAVPFGEVWMTEDGNFGAICLPPDTPILLTTAHLVKNIPTFYRLCGFTGLKRLFSLLTSIKKNYPKERHYYIPFLAATPEFQHRGLGHLFMEAILKRVDEKGLAVYIVNALPENKHFLEHLGFVEQKNVAPASAPPLIGMWRNPKPTLKT